MTSSRAFAERDRELMRGDDPQSESKCPQCGMSTSMAEMWANEGYCRSCCQENQFRLDQHNAEFDEWNQLNKQQREQRIKDATR